MKGMSKASHVMGMKIFLNRYEGILFLFGKTYINKY